MKPSITFSLFGKACLLAAIFISSCTKSNDPAPILAPAPPACKTLRSEYSSGATYKFYNYEYDSQDRLIKYAWTADGHDIESFNFEYDQKGQVSKRIMKQYRYTTGWVVTSEVASTFTFEYNDKGQVQGGNFTRTSTNPEVAPASYTFTCEYDLQGNRTKLTRLDGSISRVNLFEYRDGNCMKATYGAGADDESVSVFKYATDWVNKRRSDEFITNMFIDNLLGPTPSKHSLSNSLTTFKNRPGITVDRMYIYHFNKQGFPMTHECVTHTTDGTSTGGKSEEIEYTYACQ